MVRQPAVAGAFYPANAAVLRQMITELLKSSVAPCDTDRPKALIAPHAGYVYSGQVAGQAYAQLVTHAEVPRDSAWSRTPGAGPWTGVGEG